MRTDKLWVISVHSNPLRYRSRERLSKEFQQRMHHAGVNHMQVELALGGRDFSITEHGHALHLQVRAKDELWHKENLINLGVQNLPEDWEYVAWIDADIEFQNPNWATEIVHQLQHYKVVQLFQHAIDLGPNGEFVQQHNGFAWSWVTGLPSGKGYAHFHPGYAWACRRAAWNAFGGLMDGAILGSADHHMAWALVGEVATHSPERISCGYQRMLEIWEARAIAGIRKDVGFMPGLILHSWHGRKADRRYQDRWKIIQRHNYDPDLDIQRDWQGVLEFSHHGERLRRDVRHYFRARNEDSVDLL